jgi:competence ComEA-like helix-hairpin-helix protein
VTDAERRAIGVVLLVLACGWGCTAIDRYSPFLPPGWLPRPHAASSRTAFDDSLLLAIAQSIEGVPHVAKEQATLVPSYEATAFTAGTFPLNTNDASLTRRTDSARSSGDATRIDADRSHDGRRTDRIIDLNTADAASLTGLPGIGPVRAAAIVAERQRRGRFRDVADLLHVRGIGPVTVDRLRPFVRCGHAHPSGPTAGTPARTERRAHAPPAREHRVSSQTPPPKIQDGSLHPGDRTRGARCSAR